MNKHIEKAMELRNETPMVMLRIWEFQKKWQLDLAVILAAV